MSKNIVNVIKFFNTLLIFSFFSVLFGVSAYEVSNNGLRNLRNVIFKIDLQKPALVKVLDKNGNQLNFCYYHKDTNFCDNRTSSIIYVRIPYLPANSKFKFVVAETTENFAKDGSYVFPEYYDFKNYIPDDMNYTSIDAEGGYCFYGGNNYYIEIGNFTFENDKDYYIIKFNAKGNDGIYSNSVFYLYTPGWWYSYWMFYFYTSYPYYETGTLKLSRTKQILNYSGRYNTRTLRLRYNTIYRIKLKVYYYYYSWAKNRGFCLKSIFYYKNYSDVSIRKISPAKFEYSFIPKCYLANNNVIHRKVNCSNLPLLLSNKESIFIYNKQDDMWMEIKNFIYNVTSFPTIKITMNKLDEGIGYVKFVAAIENASFSKAYVKVPITSDVNKQLINVTKNGLPYYVTRYYLTFEFNESDPTFEAYIPVKNSKEKRRNLLDKIINLVKNLVDWVK